MTSVLHDLRFAWRLWRTTPGVALTAVLALTLGIGSTVSVFSFSRAILLRPLRFHEPDRLVHVWATERTRAPLLFRASFPDYEDWSAHARSFSALALFNYTEENLGGSDAERIPVGRVSANVFDVLGVSPVLGRGFRQGEDRPGRTQVAVLSFDFWQRRYQQDPAVLGRQIVLNDRSYDIIGVMPASFRFPLTITEVWAPHALDAAQYPRDLRTFQVVGRLAPGSTIAEAQADLSRVADDLAARHPDSNASYGVHIVPLRQALNFAYEIFRPLSIVLSAAVGLVLLVACANVTSVLLARAMGRRREIAIRLALGSSRARLLRQLLTESTALAIAGGAGGVLFAWRELRVMDASIPDDIYRVGRIGLDPQALVFALCVSVMTAMLVGFAPAWRSSRRDLRSALNEISHATTAPPQARRAQSALVVAQLALTLALVVSAALMIQSVLKLQRVDPGFDPQVLSMKVVLPRETYGGSAELRQFQRRVLEGARTVAGLEAAAIVNYLPLNHEIDLRTFSAGTAVAPAKPPAATVVTVTPDYFRTMNIPIRRGRAFTDQDDERAGRVAMIGEGLARRFFPDRDPVGQPLKLERRGGATDATIVGVAADSRFESLAGAEAPQIYLPQAQEPSRYLRLVARGASGLSAGLAAPLRRAIASVHPGLPVTEVRTMAAVLDESLLPQRGLSRALIALAIGALLLAVVGIYGVMAYFVSARTRELAIRLTLGAAPWDVARMVLARSARITAAGVVLGAAIALALARLAASFLFGVSATDVTTVAAAAAGLAAVSLFATYAPVRRAARLDPAATLRGD